MPTKHKCQGIRAQRLLRTISAVTPLRCDAPELAVRHVPVAIPDKRDVAHHVRGALAELRREAARTGGAQRIREAPRKRRAKSS